MRQVPDAGHEHEPRVTEQCHELLLVVVYGALGSLFMPFLALTLLFLMNSRAVPQQWRNRWWVNVILVLVAAMFLFLGGNELVKAVAPLFGG